MKNDGRLWAQEIKITIEPLDETAFLMQHEVNRKVLLERIASVKRGVVKHTLTIEEALASGPVKKS